MLKNNRNVKTIVKIALQSDFNGFRNVNKYAQENSLEKIGVETVVETIA